MRTRLGLFALLAACSAPRPQPPRGAVVLTVEGKVEFAPFRFGAEDLPHLPRGAFRAIAPGGQSADAKRFEGVALETVLTDKMELNHDADTAIVHGADGVEVPVPLAVVRQLRPVLADHANGTPFGPSAAGPVSLSLVWPNLDHPGIDTDPRMRWWWVGGVEKIVIQSWLATYGRALQVPAGAPASARLGADVVSAQCIGCHRIHGMGGTRGPELVRSGERPVVRASRAGLRGHLRAVSGTPSAPEITAAVADQVIAFLDSLAEAGPFRDEVEPARPGLDEELPPIGGRSTR